MSTSTIDPRELVARAADKGSQALSEYESKRVLASYGVPVIPEILAPDKKAAVAAAMELGFPVALKACSPELAHKTELGLVALNLPDAEAVEAAADSICAKTIVALDGLLVQPMAHGRREIIVGGKRDALFGPTVMLGIGGIFVEAMADVVFRLAPLEPRDALEMVNELRAQRIFGEFRGEEAADREAIARVLIAVGNILVEWPQVSQVDVNPLIIEGARPVAVDGLIVLNPKQEAKHS